MDSTIVVILVQVLVFALVVGVTLYVMRRAQMAAQTGRRLRGEAKRAPIEPRGESVVRQQKVKNRLLAWVQSSTSLKDKEDRSKLDKSLRDAGFDSPSAPAIFFIVRFGLAIGLPFAFLIAQTMSATPLTGMKLIFGALILCAIALILPQAVVDRMGQGRRNQLEREFPDALDLMVVCVEAGLGIEAAFVRVGEEVVHSHPRISQEFEMVSQELRAGRTRAEALRNLGNRTNVPAVTSFATLLIQTDALGTSVGQTLRIYSQEMRETRFLKAEEKAMRIPVLMTVPLVACILPVIITALLLPAIIDVIRTLMPALAGGS
jgi:tight adherence protein C